MILVVGDIHYDPAPARDPGSGPHAARSGSEPQSARSGPHGPCTSDRDDDRALAACLRSFEAHVTAVALLGDVYDAYVEYKHLAPKGPVRTLGLLAEWSDRGIPVFYSVGNHDPWHRDWFSSQFGFRVLQEAATLEVDGIRLHVSHGDAEEGNGRGILDRVVRSRAAHRLWTGLLPGDLGQGLARRMSRAARKHDLSERTVSALRRAATLILERGQADVVAYGHSHVPDLLHAGAGWYVNPGLWPQSRAIGVVENGKPRLVRWTGIAAESFAP